ncbi:hypothetical protein AURDEDRAFT_69965, partial [Auricularia subglabra TFB-10046 SS5]
PPTASSEELEEDPLDRLSRIEDIALVQQYIHALEAADIYNGDLSTEAISRIRDPEATQVSLSEATDRDLLLSLRLYLSHMNASEASFRKSMLAAERALSQGQPQPTKLHSLDRLKRWMRDMTGVAPIVNDMCPNSCQAYTGPLSAESTCHTCKEPRYRAGTTSRQHFYSLPLAPVIQSMHRDPDASRRFEYGAQKLSHLCSVVRETSSVPLYDDVLCGHDVLNAYASGTITDSDLLLMVSYEGCQIYRDKHSDCWIYVWIFVSVSPDLRYKKRWVIPGGFIPGPNKPKFFESFIFPGLHHIAAINKLPGGGLPIWQSHTGLMVSRRLYILLACADGPAMTQWNGLVGHSGRLGCRFLCSMLGRHKPSQGGHHYPVMLKPVDYNVPGCNHPDYDPANLPPVYSANYAANLASVCAATGPTDYRRRRAETGICKPSILSGLRSATLGVPRMCAGDIMHLVLNLGDLLVGLWRGTIDHASSDPPDAWRWRVLVGEVWQQHGRDVAFCIIFLPSSYDRAPRNPAEKINSGYKQWEFLIWLFGLGLGLLYKVLPDDYWRSYCKLVRGIRMLYLRRLTPLDIATMHRLLVEFILEFERLYVQGRADRIQFVRQSIHVLSHMAPEAQRLGPGICSSQFPMERTIGNLTEELCSHSAPYANLSERGLQRCMVNSLLAMIPGLDLDDDEDGETPAGGTLPSSAIDAGNGFILLAKMDTARRAIPPSESNALRNFILTHSPSDLENCAWEPRIVKWARLQLPNGQIARSKFKEDGKSLQNLRVTRNVKLELDGATTFGEVRYYFRFPVGKGLRTLAMVLPYSGADRELYTKSSGTVYSCRPLGEAAVRVVDVGAIAAVVAMIPHPIHFLKLAGESFERRFTGSFFVVERPGLDMVALGEPLDEDMDDLESSGHSQQYTSNFLGELDL